ncbi:hypothetical protein [Paludisphaera mucosa]|uniref:Uncharacterized protein n=1 Tax=Paludisphaera mucosa TaxID=3030827 RepID=A0ABT6F6A8_9BACT|nr:hypothetical protein [Paludisphaera mucosa]MDG3002920.1 hypothetical protein [Paludisphaera mucosa]
MNRRQFPATECEKAPSKPESSDDDQDQPWTKPPSSPDYASMMADYHNAFEPGLRGAVVGLAIEPGSRVVDMACGDGS